MKKPILLSLVLLLFGAPGITAQQAEPATRVYASYYQVGWGDLAEWLEIYQSDWVPLLQDAVDRGNLTGFGAQIHNTGGIYNFRLSMRGTQDTNFDRVNEAVLGTWMTDNPGSFNRALSFIEGHEDEIWNIDVMETDGAGEWQYMYDNMAEIPYEDWMGFTDVFNEAAGPVLAQAREDGIVSGWVIETHNTGGRFNWKVIILFPEWNDIHELQTRLLTAVPLTHPMWDYWKGHKDELWERLPAAGN